MKENIEQLFSKAKALLKENNYMEANKVIEVILLLEPDNEEALYVQKRINDLISNMDADTPLNTNLITVLGYTQAFAINPDVNIFFNDTFIGSVSRLGKFEFEAKVSGVIKFKCSFRSTKIQVESNKKTTIQLSWNRIWGTLVATKVS